MSWHRITVQALWPFLGQSITFREVLCTQHGWNEGRGPSKINKGKRHEKSPSVALLRVAHLTHLL
jgi:hypothetical protein